MLREYVRRVLTEARRGRQLLGPMAKTMGKSIRVEEVLDGDRLELTQAFQILEVNANNKKVIGNFGENVAVAYFGDDAKNLNLPDLDSVFADIQVGDAYYSVKTSAKGIKKGRVEWETWSREPKIGGSDQKAYFEDLDGWDYHGVVQQDDGSIAVNATLELGIFELALWKDNSGFGHIGFYVTKPKKFSMGELLEKKKIGYRTDIMKKFGVAADVTLKFELVSDAEDVSRTDLSKVQAFERAFDKYKELVLDEDWEGAKTQLKVVKKLSHTVDPDVVKQLELPF